MSTKDEAPEQAALENKATAEQSFANILAKAKAFIETAKQTANEYYEAYFGSVKDEEAAPEHSHHEMHSDTKRRMGRSVNAITSKPISSTKGNPTRQKKKVVVSKSYKPELDRF